MPMLSFRVSEELFARINRASSHGEPGGNRSQWLAEAVEAKLDPRRVQPVPAESRTEAFRRAADARAARLSGR